MTNTAEQQIVLITGASSGFGLMSAQALARAGHVAYASMRGTKEKNADKVDELATLSKGEGIDLRTIELDVGSEESAEAAVAAIIAEHGRIDVVMHNAGHMVYGPSEAFTPEQLAQQYDVNVLSTQRVNRAVLPHMREAGRGLLLWNSSSSVAGGTPPYLGPYFAAKAAMDALAVIYARELSLWGIETAILVPGAFTKGTNHFANAGAPEDASRVAEYEAGPYAGYADKIQAAFADIVPEDADPALVARAVVDIVTAPIGKRPFRTVVDPTHDGAEIGFAVIDRLRGEMLNRTGLSELLESVTRSR
ncbi:MAG: SDR family NAD(P)-dependent oxidoreductase [Myxococcales bacterium]|nr:SDR family NAD(P)-dependent oxidoreductase [Myxococcales bacterium]